MLMNYIEIWDNNLWNPDINLLKSLTYLILINTYFRMLVVVGEKK